MKGTPYNVFICRFSTLQEQALVGLKLLPSITEECPASDFSYFIDDLPYPESFHAELDLWKFYCQDGEMAAKEPMTLKSALTLCNKEQFPNVQRIFTIMCKFPVTSCEK